MVNSSFGKKGTGIFSQFLLTSVIKVEIMINYIIRRLAILPILFTGITILIFGMLSLLTPYERVALYVTDIPKRPGAIDEVIIKYGLDDPIPTQYWNWLVGKTDDKTGEIKGGILRGDLGWSVTGKSTVKEAILRKLPATAELAIWAAIPLIGISIWMGVMAAVNHNKKIDQILRVLAIGGWSIPTFVLGLLFLLYFYSDLGWFPPGRISIAMKSVIASDSFIEYTRLHTLDALLNLRFDVFWDALKHLVLPVVTLSVVSWAFLLRVTRSSMLDTLRQDYLTTARAKGLPEKLVVRRHAVPNGLIPVITVGGLTLIGLFNGVVITESIYNIKGMGSFIATAAGTLDIVTVLGVTMFTSLILVFGNLIVDVLYGIVDPRIRLQ
jgi:peptide/nickel transport system permease protein